MPGDLTLTSALLKKIKWHEQAQKTISENIANADTPGYQPQEIAPLDFKALLSKPSSPLAKEPSNPNFLPLRNVGTEPVRFKITTQKTPYERSPNGNAVVLEEQMLHMNKAAADHAYMLNLYEKQVKMIKDASN